MGRQITSPIAKPTSAATVVAGISADAAMERAISSGSAGEDESRLRDGVCVRKRACGQRRRARPRRLRVGSTIAGNAAAAKAASIPPASAIKIGLWTDDALAADRERGCDIAGHGSVGDERDDIAGEQAEHRAGETEDEAHRRRARRRSWSPVCRSRSGRR